MTGPHAENNRVLRAQLRDADKTHAKALSEYRKMKARAEAAEKREATLREALERIANYEGTYVGGTIFMAEVARAALEAKP